MFVRIRFKANRLRIVKMPNGGKNAADFGITFWAGMLMAQSPANAHFDIVSDDADLDHVVGLLIHQQRSAKRIRTKKENIPESSNRIHVLASAREYCLYLNAHQKNRPVKKETLLNHISNKFNGAGVDAEKIFQSLCEKGVI